jgi:hypothetical protein
MPARVTSVVEHRSVSSFYVVLQRGNGVIEEFKAFALKGNMVDLAIAVVLGGAFARVIESLVADIIMPIIGIFGGNPDFTTNKFTISGSEFRWGNFLGNSESRTGQAHRLSRFHCPRDRSFGTSVG